MIVSVASACFLVIPNSSLLPLILKIVSVQLGMLILDESDKDGGADIIIMNKLLVSMCWRL